MSMQISLNSKKVNVVHANDKYIIMNVMDFNKQLKMQENDDDILIICTAESIANKLNIPESEQLDKMINIMKIYKFAMEQFDYEFAGYSTEERVLHFKRC
jgi:hypothetical protein